MIIIVSFFSFVFDFIFNYFFKNSLFLPLIILTSVIVLRPYFKKVNFYYLFCFIVGFLYDLLYTGNYFMSSAFFLIIGLLICFISANMPNNFFVSIFEVIVSIVLYRVMCFIFLFLNGIVSFSFELLFKSVYCSLIINIIYCIIMYFILYFISKKFKIERIN